MNLEKMNITINKQEGKQLQTEGFHQKITGKLIGDEIEVIQGINKILVGKLQEVYGMTQEEAEKRVREYEL